MQTAKHRLTAIWAFSLIPVMLQAISPKTDLDLIQAALGVPPSIAKVSDGMLAYGGAIPEVILVQDVHRHPEVQGHIAALVLYGSHHWNLRDIYLEGALATVPVQVSPDQGGQSLTDALQQGRLSGAEMAVALDPRSPLQLHGIEDPDLYRRNVAAYEHVQRVRDAAQAELKTARVLENSLDMGSASEERWGLMDKMLQLRLKPSEEAAYRDHRYIGQGGSMLKEALEAAEDFYGLADLRSETFVKNLESNTADGPRLVVVGGYHTAAMAESLRRQGRSFVVLTPNVTQSGYDDLYARGMQQTISALNLH